MEHTCYVDQQEESAISDMLVKGEEEIRQGLGVDWETVKAEAEAILNAKDTSQ